MHQATERVVRQSRHIQELRRRTQELERMLAIGAHEAKIRQRQAEIQSLLQRKAALESELLHLQRALHQLEDASR